MLVVGVAPPWQPSCPKCILSLPRLVMDACLPHGMRLWVTISTVKCADDQGVGFLVRHFLLFSSSHNLRSFSLQKWLPRTSTPMHLLRSAKSGCVQPAVCQGSCIRALAAG